jgi:hypothetical protein
MSEVDPYEWPFMSNLKVDGMVDALPDYDDISRRRALNRRTGTFFDGEADASAIPGRMT